MTSRPIVLSAVLLLLSAACSGGSAKLAGEDAAPPSRDGTETASADIPAACEGKISAAPGLEITMDYWEGDGAVSVAEFVAPAGCVLRVESDVPWIKSSDGRVELIREGMTSGRIQGVVRAAAEGLEPVSITVRVNALVKPPAGASRRVLIIGIDGLRPDALQAAGTTALALLQRKGAWTMKAGTQLDAITKSGPGWASILTGAEAGKHRVDSNDDLAEINHAEYPTLAGRADMLGIPAVFASQWIKLANLIEERRRKDIKLGEARDVAEFMADMIRRKNLALHFIHFDDVDRNGHLTGFSVENPDYLRAIRSVDRHAGNLLNAILDRPDIVREDWLIGVTTDHGGEGNDHGPKNAANRTIPLIFAGPSIARGEMPGEGYSQMDVYPTAFAFLGHAPRPDWKLDGKNLVPALTQEKP
ncbi:MAG: hypothetical protein GMKNLPBB_00050 [Myxococcota bacterium]|nr:hypothetical protein [Myxococcota bacterium]